MKARLAVLATIAAVLGCRDVKPPTEAMSPNDPSKIILDGAHGGNKDFFFLPPMVPLPVGNPDFELGKFNNTLRSSIRIEICELRSESLNAQGLPTEATRCIAGTPIKTFAPGTVQLVNLPLRQNGWWTLFGLPPDGFYYVLWDTRQSNLNVSKYYRIKVLIDGSTTPLGVADVDPMANLFQWKYTNTGQVIQLVDDVLLPIPFRIEKGGGSALCGDASLCVSTVVTNNSPTGFQTVTVDGGAGAIAGAKFPNNWLPPGGPQSVVVTIHSVNLGATDPQTGAETTPCHTGLPLQQFPGCFNFSTTPRLAFIGDTDHQFAQPVIVAVCYSLQNSGDAREKFAEMYASGPNEPPHALPDADDAGILSPAARNCNTTPVIGAAPSKGVTGFAQASWRKMKEGVGSLFSVKTAYGVDLGLGGFSFAFSNIGPALSASMVAVSPTAETIPGGGLVQRYVRLVGSNHHDGEHQNSVGFAGLSVEFTRGEVNAPIGQIGDEIINSSKLTVVTNAPTVGVEGPPSGGGFAAVNWSVPSFPGTYHLTANGPALNGPITFTVTVPPPPDVLFRALFTDGLLNQPGSADIGTLDAADIIDGTALVQSDIGGIAGKSLQVSTPGEIAGAPNVFARVAGTPPTSGVYLVRWRSSATSGLPTMNFVARSSTALVLAAVNYAGGTHTFNAGSGASIDFGTYTANVPQRFELRIDLTAKTVSLSVDGVAVPSVQNQPYFQSAAANLAWLSIEFGGLGAYSMAWDDIEIVAEPSSPVP